MNKLKMALVRGVITSVLALSAGAARAGDLPSGAGSAGNVRQCSAAGSGFFYVPGTDTCLSIGGYVWAEGYYNTYTNYPAADPKTYTIATYGLQLDSRTETDYGTLRSFIDIRFQYRTAEEWGAAEPAGNRAQANPWTIYIQYAGFTFGYLQSFFDFYANENVYGTDPATIGDDTQITVLAYTWQLGNGWAATVSLEDASARDAGVEAAATASTTTYGYTSQVPEIIGAVGQSGDWGKFQLSGALHRIGIDTSLSAAPRIPPFDIQAQSGWGYALQAGVMFNLPMLAEGDTLYLQTAYVDGAVSYLGLINPSGDFAPPDAFVNPDGSLSTVTGWNMTGQFLHNLNARWQATAFGGYAQFDFDNMRAEKDYGASGGINYNVGGNIAWLPSASFGVILQYEYNVYEAKNYVNTGSGLPVAAQKAHQVLLMAQRNF